MRFVPVPAEGNSNQTTSAPEEAPKIQPKIGRNIIKAEVCSLATGMDMLRQGFLHCCQLVTHEGIAWMIMFVGLVLVLLIGAVMNILVILEKLVSYICTCISISSAQHIQITQSLSLSSSPLFIFWYGNGNFNETLSCELLEKIKIRRQKDKDWAAIGLIMVFLNYRI